MGVGDEMQLVSSDPNRVPLSEIMRLYSAESYSTDDVAAVQRVLSVEAVPESWKGYFRERLVKNPTRG